METKRRVDHLVRFIRSFGVRCGAIHGDKSQSERDFVLREFRSGKSNILVATDVAARGLGKFGLHVKDASKKVYLEFPSDTIFHHTLWLENNVKNYNFGGS